MARIYRTSPPPLEPRKPRQEFISRLLEYPELDQEWGHGFTETTEDDVAQYVRFHR